jgi:cyclomaltodextrinase
MDIKIYHHSQKSLFKNPFGAIPCSTAWRLSLYVSEQVDEVSVIISHPYGQEIVQMKEKLEANQLVYEASMTSPKKPGLLWYYFKIRKGHEFLFYGNNHQMLGGEGEVYETSPYAYQVTLFEQNFHTPMWVKDGILYQIFVDRFYPSPQYDSFSYKKGNRYFHETWDEEPFYLMHPYEKKVAAFDFHGGNLQGIRDKLPYLKDLGITILYLNPIFEAESNHKYDTGDYLKVDHMFGNEEILASLCQEAKILGIHIILDGVFSHTGSESRYFNKSGRYNSSGAYQSQASPYYPWYRFKVYPDQYDSWWGIETLPNVNELEPSYVDFICKSKDSVIRHWMKIGIKGWRLDVADELPDEFIRILRETIKAEDQAGYLLGEVWEDASNKESYGQKREYLYGHELDGVMNYPFRNMLLSFILGQSDGHELQRRWMNLLENYPLECFYSSMNLLSSHDIPRILTILGEAPLEQNLSKEAAAQYRLPQDKKDLAIKRLKLLVSLQMTLPGIPAIYYGDEVEAEGYSDPLNRRTYPWGNENKELLAFYQQFTKLRHAYAPLKTGEYIPVEQEKEFFCYRRQIEKEQDIFGEPRENGNLLIIAYANDAYPMNCHLRLDQELKGRKLVNIMTQETYFLNNGQIEIFMEPISCKILWVQE